MVAVGGLPAGFRGRSLKLFSLDGSCVGEEFPILRFESEFSGKGTESPASGDGIDGVLSLLGPGAWELIVFRRGTDESAESGPGRPRFGHRRVDVQHSAPPKRVSRNLLARRATDSRT
jgi:hypothetical protein